MFDFELLGGRVSFPGSFERVAEAFCDGRRLWCFDIITVLGRRNTLEQIYPSLLSNAIFFPSRIT